MSIKIENNTIRDSGVGISVPATGNIEVHSNDVSDCQRAIEVRDAPGLLQALGLPRDTPPDLLRDALAMLLDTQEDSDASRVERFKVSKLGAWLGTAANVAQIASTFMSLQQGGYLQKMMEILPK